MYLLTRCNHSLNVKVACTKFNVTICPSYKTKLIERKYILFFFFEKKEGLCRFIHRTYLVLVMHVYCVANCGHNRITSCFSSLHYSIRYLNNLSSLVGISHWNTYIFVIPLSPLYHSISLSLSLSFSYTISISFGKTAHAQIPMYMNIVTTFGKRIKFEYHTWMTGTSRCFCRNAYINHNHKFKKI